MAKGRKTGGRTKGVPNKVTSRSREAFQLMFERLSPDVEGWIRRAAEGEEVVKTMPDGSTVTARLGADPAKAADLVIRLAEYHVPKLGRVEVSGPEGGPVEFVIRDLAREDGQGT